MIPELRFDNSYARLPSGFFEKTLPTPVAAPTLLKLNWALADELGFDLSAATPGELALVFSGNKLLLGAEPLAQAYAGHQFGYFVRELGDGRALLLGEVIDRHGQRKDVQLKGSGPTRFSRRGDGRAALGPVMREYILGEAMHYLGVPTTRGLAIVATGEEVYRETPLPGAILTRVAASHVRIGTFEYFASREDRRSVQTLADYVIDRHYMEIKDRADKYLALLRAVALRQAKLISKWMSFGFIHGVMNTDNMAISGETIDFGPCAFLDDYHPQKVFSSIDRQGRYSFGNQPGIAAWNLSMLASCLLPLFSDSKSEAVTLANEALTAFDEDFTREWEIALRLKFGFTEDPRRETNDNPDAALIQNFFDLMTNTGADFTLCFRYLSRSFFDGTDATKLREQFKNSPDFETWLKTWRSRCQKPDINSHERSRLMLSVNPAFIARNHRVEEAIQSALQKQDLAPFERLLIALKTPFADQPEREDLMAAPRPEQKVTATFCGT